MILKITINKQIIKKIFHLSFISPKYLFNQSDDDQLLSMQQIKKQMNGVKVNLSNLSINDNKLELIYSLKCNHVKHLDLKKNMFTVLGLIRFSQPKWTSLQVLYLGNNKIGDKACKYISRAPLQQITKMALDYNQIGSAGLIHLSKAKWKKISKLVLNFNRINERGPFWISKGNFNLIITLWIHSNYLVAHQIHYLLLSNFKPIKQFSFYNNLINTKDVKLIQKSLAQSISSKF